MRYLYLTIALVASVILVHGQSFDGSRLSKGIKFAPKDSSFSIQWNTRFQTQYVGVHSLEKKEYTDAFTIRRFRLKFKGFILNPNIQYKIELALSNRDQGDFYVEQNGAASIVLDAVLKWKFHPRWQLWIGQTKLPGNRERVISSGALQLVDRSRLNSRYNIDRDKGIQLRHEFNAGMTVLRGQLAISSGEGRNITASNESGYDYTIRGEILPFGKFASKGDYFGADFKREPKPKLALGVTFDYNVGSNRERGQLGRFVFDANGNAIHSDLATIFADVIFKHNGFIVMYEYVYKKVNDGSISGIESDESTIVPFYTGQAHNIQGGYLFKNNTSLDLRFTKNDPSKISIPTDPSREYVDDPEKRYEIGFSKYFAGHTFKFQSSIVYRDRMTKGDQMIYFAQLEIGF